MRVTAGTALRTRGRSRVSITWRWTSKASPPGRVSTISQPRRTSMPESAALEFAPEMRQRWAWSADDIRHFGHLVVDLIAHHLTSLPERPVFRPFPPELAARFLSAALPLMGQEPE